MTLHEDIKKQIEQAFAAARVADVQVDCSNEISIIDPVALNKLIKKIPTRRCASTRRPLLVGIEASATISPYRKRAHKS